MEFRFSFIQSLSYNQIVLMTAQVSDKVTTPERTEVFQEGSQDVLKPQKQDSQPDLQPDAGEVSDFMDGLDVPNPSEKVSERVREDDKKQQGSKAGQAHSDGDDFSFSGVAPLKLPTQRIMVRRIRKELHREIKSLMKQAKLEEKKGAFYLTRILEKIRRLKGTLSGLATATYEVIKKLYISFFEKKEGK